MPDHKLRDATMPTPSRSNLAQILLDLRGVEGVGLCSLQQSDIQLCLESYRQENNQTIENDQSSQQDTCNCRKSKCLKLYCQCFAARATCSSSCRCVSCENRPDNATARDAAVNMILERNPNAFDSKYRPTAPVASSIGTAAMSSTFTAITSVAHKNGCRCRKSMCLKKYCECYQGGVPCSSICTCLSCQNTGPATTLMTAAAAAAAAAATNAIGATTNLQSHSDLLLLSSHNQLSDQSMFANPSRLNESNEYSSSLLETNRSFAAKAGVTEEAGLGGANRPPLAPSLKRKRESGAGSSNTSTSREGVEAEKHTAGQMEEHSEDHEQQTEQEQEADQTFFAPPLTPAGVNMSMSMSMNLSREQQKQLLNELLFQELQSQGMLTSPLTSYLTNNCPGLLMQHQQQQQQQSEGSTMDDIMNLFRKNDGGHINKSSATGSAGGGGVVGTPAGPTAGGGTGGTLLSYTPANATSTAGASVGAHDASDSASTTKTAMPTAVSGGTGLASASPNTFSIATALALLAASGHFQTLAKQQQEQLGLLGADLAVPIGGAGAEPGSAMGICEVQRQQLVLPGGGGSNTNNSSSRSRSSVPTSALALATARKQQQLQMHHDHDPFASLAKLESGHPIACTPVAAATQLLGGGGRGGDANGEAPSSAAEVAPSSSSSRKFARFSQLSMSGSVTDGETTVGSSGGSSSNGFGSTGRSSLSDESMYSISSMSGSEGKDASLLMQHKYKHHHFGGGNKGGLGLQAFSPQQQLLQEEPSTEQLLLLGLPAKALFASDGPLSPDNDNDLIAHSTAILAQEDKRDSDDRLLRLLAKENIASPNKNKNNDYKEASAGGHTRAMIGMEKHNTGRNWR